MKESDLLALAIEARKRAYAPYSRFYVGSALLLEDGQVLTGCNVENASYGASNCAERTVLFAAIAAGYAPRTFQAIAVAAESDQPVSPCGICRQVLAELCPPDMPVVMGNVRGEIAVQTVAELLPHRFHLPSDRFKE